jgi:hypothetical protein
MDAGKAKGFWKTLTRQSLTESYDGLGASLILTSNPAIQVSDSSFLIGISCYFDPAGVLDHSQGF